MPDSGNSAQVRIIADQVGEAAAEIAIRKFAQTYAPGKPDIPPALRWAAGIVTAVLTALIVGACLWMTSTLNDLQLTVARIDERQQRDTTADRLSKIEDRLARLERGTATGSVE